MAPVKQGGHISKRYYFWEKVEVNHRIHPLFIKGPGDVADEEEIKNKSSTKRGELYFRNVADGNCLS